MDHMIIGTTVPFLDGASFTVYSPWTTRQGDCVRLSVELITTGLDVKVAVQTKNIEDVDPTADLASATASSNPLTVRTTGVKELVRYKVVTNPSLDTLGLNLVHMRCLDPQWEQNL